MADVLQTVLQLVGGQQYLAQINGIAKAHQQLAVAQQRQAVTARQLAHLQAAGAPLALQGGAANAAAGAAGAAGLAGSGFAGAIVAGAVAALGAVTAEVKEASRAFVDYDRAIIGTQFTLQRMGQALPTEQFIGFARQLSLATGTAETDLINLQGYLARFGTDAPTIQRASRTINDAAILTGHSVEEMAQQFEMARRGHAKEFFKELGIPIRGVEGQLYDLNQIVDIVDKHIHGFGATMGKELPGEVARASAAMKMMQDEVGRLVSPVTEWWERFKIGFGVGVAGLAHLASQFLHVPLPGAQHGGNGPVGALGGPGRPRSEEYLRRIELNTGPQGALGRALREGGAYGEYGGGLHIRDLNQMLRHR